MIHTEEGSWHSLSRIGATPVGWLDFSSLNLSPAGLPVLPFSVWIFYLYGISYEE